MSRNLINALSILLLSISSLPAASIQPFVQWEPTPGLPGYSTVTVSANSSHPMQGFDFAGDGSNDPATGRGFFGTINQVNPFGQPTVYTDLNSCLVCLDLYPRWFEHDSHFLPRTGDVVVPAGFSEESQAILQGIWAHSSPVGTSISFAQIVVPDNGGYFSFRGVISVLENGSIVELPVQGFYPIPEPASWLLACLAICWFRRHR